MVTLGLVTPKHGTIARQDDDKPLDFWGQRSIILDRSEGLSWDPGLGLGGAVLQVKQELSNFATLSLGMEGLDLTQPGQSSWTDPGPGTVVASLAYDDGTTVGHATGIAAGVLDGHADRLAAHGGLNVELETLRLSGGLKVETEPRGKTTKWAALASAAFDDGLINIAGSVETGAELSRSNYWTASASAGVHVTDALLIELAGYIGQANTTNMLLDTKVLSVGAEWHVTEQVTLQADIGRYEINSPGLSIGVSYAAGAATWRPGGGVEMMAKGELYSNGALRTAAAVRKSFE